MGVYSWCRVVAGKKFSWVKASAEKAGRRWVQCVLVSVLDVHYQSLVSQYFFSSAVNSDG